MTSPFFHYITPLLFPLFPLEGGELVVGLNLKKILFTRAIESVTGTLDIRITVHKDGTCESEEKLSIPVSDGNPDTEILWRNYALKSDVQGYVEVTISADQSIFRKLDLPVGYATVKVPDYGAVTLIPDAKFARPIVIKQILVTQTFCLVHSACRWKRDANAGTSVFFLNPYEKDITATILSQVGKLKKKVGPKQVLRVPLETVLEGDKLGTIMITANNRIPAWVINHTISEPFHINSVDHLDVYRGDKTHKNVSPFVFLKMALRRLLRRFGQVY